MDKIEDLKIKGLDPNRQPNLDNNNYIDVVYELTQQAPRNWCLDFNNFFSKERHKTRIDPDKGLYIETWVRDIEEISTGLNLIKQKIKICNANYVERLKNEALQRKSLLSDNLSIKGKKLEKVIAGLNFD